MIEEGIIFRVSAGDTTSKIAQDLYQQGLIKNPQVFRILIRLQGRDGRLKVGYYHFDQQLSLLGISDQLYQGQVLRYRLTVPEGLSLEQVAKVVENVSDIPYQDFIQVAESIELNYDYLPPPSTEIDYQLQGYLFPATYYFDWGSSPGHLIRTMVARFDVELTPAHYQRAKDLGFSIHELITLASIVEKEGRIDDERPLIAGVFHNRIAINMKLQACATVQYALGEWKPRLLYQDLRYDSLYNTYLHAGLPPGPIANPGSASINAAFFPQESDYLFFFALPDGSHFFSRTYQEHLQNQ